MTPASRGNCSADNGSVGGAITKHLSLLHGVIRSGRWSAFENIALSNPSVFRMICSAMPTCDEFRGTSLLHVCLRYSAPLKIVAKIIEMYPDRTAALRARDGMGRTPLHVAAACDADAMVIKLLGSADPATCNILDDDGRTPLHLACDISGDIIHDENDKPPPPKQREAPSYDVVRALLSESLEPTLVEDEDGMSPLEYAIISGASIEVVNLLQKATMHVLRKGGGEDHSQNNKRKRLPASVITPDNTHFNLTSVQRRRALKVSF